MPLLPLDLYAAIDYPWCRCGMIRLYFLLLNCVTSPIVLFMPKQEELV